MGDRSARNVRPREADENELARTLTALMSLPAGLRKVLYLREVAGLTMEEVATSLGLSRRAVERRLMRAIVLLSERLDKMERVGGG